MIQARLFALRDEKFGDFHSSLIPGLSREKIIGIRMPAMRKLAKEFAKEPEAAVFLKQLPHTYYDENILHALLIAGMKDYDACMETLEAFLPYIDNWAVCDGLSPKVFGKHKAELLEKSDSGFHRSIPTFAGLEWACSCAGFWMRTFSRNIWRCLPRSVQKNTM